MKTWIIFDRNGLAKCEAHKLEYSGEFLGACSVNVDITSPTPIGFEIGDYLEYRGERFEMNYDPSVVKQASAGAHGESFLYSGVVFNALSDELTRCEFLDYVPSDNEMHYSSLPTFSFFAENVEVLAERIQVNLDRIYTGAKKWSVNIHGERTEAKNVNVTISNQSCWDALGLVKTLFGENFIVRGRTITIGTSGIVMGSTLTYGKGNGLCKIERNAESNQKIITRLRAYGSTRNMSPAYYRSLGVKVFGEVIWIVDREATDHLKCYLNIPYEEGLFADGGNVTVRINGVEASATITKHEVKDEFEGCCVLYAASPELFAVTQDGMKAYFLSGANKHKFPQSNKEYLENVPNNMAVMHLMLPSFPNETLDPYLDSKHIDVLGVREGTVFFDGSNGLEEIYPTMEGMTAEDLKASGIDVEAEGNLDEVVSAELIEDDGVPANINDIPPFQITLKDIGFDINQYLGTSQPTISMKDGMCGGREFEIQSCKKEGTNYVLTCNRSEDSSLGLFFPYKDYPIRTGDKFVLLNLEMPDVYVQAASQRLLKAAQDYLKKHDYVRYSYIPSVDNIYMARQHDEAIANGGVSIHDTIKEGDFLLFEDDDLGIKGSVTISSLRIKEDISSSLIPEYDIVLQEEKTLGTIERIQNQINNIEAGGVTGSVNTEQVQGIVKSIADKNYLSKTKDDRSKGIIASDKGFEAGKFIEGVDGVAIYKNATGQWCIETDNVNVRRKFSAKEVEIQTTTHIGGQMLLSAASMTIENIEENNDSYRCFFRKKDGEGNVIYNQWKEGDLAYCNTFNLEKQSDGTVGNHFYWREVVGISSDSYSDEWHYVDISKTLCALDSSEPKVGDKVVHLGYSKDDDKERQNAIVIAGAGSGSPYIRLFVGIKPFELPEPEQLKPGDNRLSGRLSIKAGSTGWENIEGLNDTIKQTKSELEQALKKETEAAQQLAIEEANAYADGIVTKEEEERIRQAEENLAKAKEYAEQLKVELDDKMNNLEYGKNNLLLNSGFTGDFVTASLGEKSELGSSTKMFSPSLKYWTSKNVFVFDSAISESTMEAIIGDGGSLEQKLEFKILPSEKYVFSFRGKGGSIKMILGDVVETFILTDELDAYMVKFTATEGNVFRLESTGQSTICELQLERGTLKSAWGMSPLDNRSELAKYETLTYLKDLLRPDVQTTIDGGTINTGLITMGKVSDEGDLSEITAGVSGQYMDDDSVAFWAGGKWEDAIFAVNTYLDNPNYTPTEDELRKMAHYVVTHGGRAILNDVILRGYIYALGGKFKGEVEATSGKFNGAITAKSMNLSVTDGGDEGNPTDLTTSGGFRLEGYYRLPLLKDDAFTELVGFWVSGSHRSTIMCTILCNESLIEVLYYNGTMYNGVSQINISHEGGYIKASMMGHQYSEWGGQCWNLNIEKSSDVYVEIISHA